MKCLCGLNEKPDNIHRLRTHLKECERAGRLPKSKKGHFILWRDGEFTVTTEKKKNEQDFGTELPEGKKPELIAKVGLPTYTPTESLLAPQKTRVNEIGEDEKPKRKRR
jgi:hypothetical protein